MTALAGWVADRNNVELERACSSMLRALAPYSRQESRIAVAGRAAFGAALFPTLPEDDFDAQPIAFGDRLLIADVRLDNREELAAMLDIAPSHARALADAAIVAVGWQRWGDDCLRRIVGDFAIAVYDAAERKLSLARDITGQRPLFYTANSGGIAVASMPSGLLALESNRRGFDLRTLAQVLADVPPASDASYFKGIRRVPPGHLLTWTDGVFHSGRFWEPSRARLNLGTDGDYVEAYRDVLSSAVKSRMRRRSAVLGSQLSAGFDSSAVTATAALLREPGDHLIAFTSAPRTGFTGPLPRGRIADESAIAGRTAAMHGIDHVVLRSAGSIFTHIAQQSATYQEPYRNIVNSGWITALEQTAGERGATVMLAGDLGNLTLNFGSLELLSGMIADGEWLDWWREARLARQSGRVRWRGILINSFEPWLPAGLRSGLYTLFQRPRRRPDFAFLRPEWRSKVFGGAKASDDHRASADTFADRWKALRAFDFGTIRKGALGATGIDTRDVMADRRVIQFSLNLPRKQLFADGQARPLARLALADRLPSEVLDSKVRGYQAADWHEHADLTELRAMIERASTSAAASELIDFQRLLRAVDDWPSSGFERTDVMEKFVGFVPTTLATALFVQEFESIAGITG